MRGHGRNYPSELAKRGHQVHVVVPSRWRYGVEKELTEAPIDNLAFHFVEEREWPMHLGWTVGSALRYFLWQWDASQAALKADRASRVRWLHHVRPSRPCSVVRSCGGLANPSLWPDCGGQTAPPALSSYFGSFRRSEALRTLVIRSPWPLGPAGDTERAVGSRRALE